MKKIIVVACFMFFSSFSVAQAASTYIVKAGDNLWTIASANGVTVAELQNWNSLKSDFLQIGDKLIIGPPNQNSPQPQYTAPPSASQESNSSTYTVQANDNLWLIAQKYNTTVEQIKLANNLSSDALQIGDRLIIPGSLSSSGPSPSRSYLSNTTPVTEKQNNDSNENELVKTAAKYLGTPYKYGGQSPGGFDCSGFVRYVFLQHDIELPRTAAGQASVGVHVDKSDLLPGDLVFFTCYSKSIDHSGIYVGGGRFIHSSSPRSGGVIYSSLSEGFYAKTYYGARRI